MSRFPSVEAAGHYLAAMIDGEGWVGAQDRTIEIGNTEPDVIEATQEACEACGIHCRVQWRKAMPGRKVAGVVRIGTIDNLIRVQRFVPIQMGRKKAALAAAIDGYTKKKRLPIVEELAELYRSGMSLGRMAVEFGVGIGTITRKLKNGRIPIRPRKEAACCALTGGVPRINHILRRLDADALRRMYWDGGMSADEIARQYRVSPQGIRRRMRQVGVPLRTTAQAMRHSVESWTLGVM